MLLVLNRVRDLLNLELCQMKTVFIAQKEHCSSVNVLHTLS